MHSFQSKLVTSVLILIVVIGIGTLGFYLWLKRQNENSMGAEALEPLTVYSVPEAYVTEQAKGSEGIYASVRLTGFVDTSGQMTEVRPYPMLPYGIPESAAGSGEFADVTPAKKDGRFVKQLPNDILDTAIQEARGIQFIRRSPKCEATREEVNIITQFGFVGSSGFPKGCGSIEVTVFDKTGTWWLGETSVNECKGYR